jgi:hypothetical protein
LLSKLDEENTAVGAVCVTVLTQKDSGKYGAKCILRTKKVRKNWF